MTIEKNMIGGRLHITITMTVFEASMFTWSDYVKKSIENRVKQLVKGMSLT